MNDQSSPAFAIVKPNNKKSFLEWMEKGRRVEIKLLPYQHITERPFTEIEPTLSKLNMFFAFVSRA